jgi:hypothetical protein
MPGQGIRISKYNSLGTFLWTYNGTTGSAYDYAEFTVLPSGSVIWGEGYNGGGARIYKISPSGVLQITGGPYPTNEVWTVFYNRCSNQILGFGGGTTSPNNLQIVNDTNLTVGIVRVW